MRYLVRVDGEPGPRGRTITSHRSYAAARLTLDHDLMRLRALGATVAGDARHGYIAAHQRDGVPAILRLAVEQAP